VKHLRRLHRVTSAAIGRPLAITADPERPEVIVNSRSHAEASTPEAR
jgi:hypothetical protein